jgi:hypothetical protein
MFGTVWNETKLWAIKTASQMLRYSAHVRVGRLLSFGSKVWLTHKAVILYIGMSVPSYFSMLYICVLV